MRVFFSLKLTLLQAGAGEDDIIHLQSGLDRVACERQEEEEEALGVVSPAPDYCEIARLVCSNKVPEYCEIARLVSSTVPEYCEIARLVCSNKVPEYCEIARLVSSTVLEYCEIARLVCSNRDKLEITV